MAVDVIARGMAGNSLNEIKNIKANCITQNDLELIDDGNGNLIQINYLNNIYKVEEKYHKITLTDYNDDGSGNYTLENNLILVMRVEDFNYVLEEINTQMGTNLKTPQDFIDFYDSVKGNSSYTAQCAYLFASMTQNCLQTNTNVLFRDSDLRAYNRITAAIGSPIPFVQAENLKVINLISPDTQITIGFTSNSTVSILTNQNNQDIDTL